MTESLDWPVRRGAAAVIGGNTVRAWFRPGTTEETPFQVASVTKPFVALGTLAAVERELLGLDEAVEPAGPGVTVRHLLAHASGLPFEPGPRARPPGSRRIYSNLGYRVLGATVERAAGRPLPEWIAETVLGPAGMASSRLDDWASVAADPAAGLVSTLDDLVRAARCLLAGGAPVIGPGLFAEAIRVQYPGLPGLVPGVGFFDPCDWGLGFELRAGKRPHWMGDGRSPAAYGHFGASGCFLWVDPVRSVAAVAVTDRYFDDERWGMRVWPAWSNEVAGGRGGGSAGPAGPAAPAQL